MSEVEFDLRAVDRVCLPRYSGSTVRGALGRALHMRTCVTEYETCKGCPLARRCAYAVVWRPAPPEAGTAPKRFGDPPPPYVLDPMQYGARSTFLRDDRLAFRLRVMGEARSFVPYLILAMRDAGRAGLGRGRGRLELVRATSLDHTGRPVRLYEDGRLQRWGRLQELRVAPYPLPHADGPERVRLLLETPLQLKSKGRVAQRVSPDVFTSRLASRLDALCTFHESDQPRCDHERLADLAGQARVVRQDLVEERFERYSRSQDGRHPMQGLLGTVVFEEVHPDVVALWRVAEHIHVGNKATFGFGKVRVDRLDA